MEHEFTTAAVYLAGYAVECVLKALVLGNVAAGRRARLVESFRGTKAHDFEWLKALYEKEARRSIPKAIALCLRRVNTWSTDLRYVAGRLTVGEATAFLSDVGEIVEWATEQI